MAKLLNRRVALTFAATLVLAACSKSAPTTSASAPASAAKAAVTGNTYLVASNAAFAPFESVDPSGKIVGFDVDVLEAVAAKGGFKVRFVNTPWEGIFNTLNSGEAHIVASGVTITDVRKQSMDFSQPYFEAKQLIAVKPDSKAANFNDVKAQTIGVLTGSTGDEVVSKLIGKTNTQIKRFESTPMALQELQAGGVNSVVSDNGVIRHYVTNNANSKFKLLEDASFEPEFYGFVVKKGNTELQGKIDTGLKAIKADGTYDKIYSKWFGTAPAATAAKPASAPASAASK